MNKAEAMSDLTLFFEIESLEPLSVNTLSEADLQEALNYHQGYLARISRLVASYTERFSSLPDLAQYSYMWRVKEVEGKVQFLNKMLETLPDVVA